MVNERSQGFTPVDPFYCPLSGGCVKYITPPTKTHAHVAFEQTYNTGQPGEFWLPKAHRDKPKKDEISWAQESFDNEIHEVKPDIIVTLGKPVFDYLTGLKVPLKDIKGAWFRSERFNCRVFPMDNITRPVSKPEYTEKFRVELCEVKKMLDTIDGKPLIEITRQYTITENMSQLRELVQQWDTSSS